MVKVHFKFQGIGCFGADFDKVAVIPRVGEYVSFDINENETIVGKVTKVFHQICSIDQKVIFINIDPSQKPE